MLQIIFLSGYSRRVLAGLLLVALMLSAGCSSGKSWHLKDVSHLLPPLAFHATGPDGKSVTADQFRGKVLLVYFGYTHCPDVCPTMLAKLSGVLSAMGNAASDVQILFISVDPQRDTPADLKRYAAAFGPNVIGLHIAPDELKDLARLYRVTYTAPPADRRENYEVTHSNGTFIFDRQGNARLVATGADTTTDIRSDLMRLLQEKKN